MGLEEALNNAQFEGLIHRARVNLIYTHAWLQEGIRQFLEPYGITQPQFNALRILRGVHPEALSTKDLTSRMIDRATDASRLVDRLQRKGWVQKEPCAHDRRRVDVRICQKGLALLSEIDQNRKALDELLSRLSEAELVQLNELLDKIRGD